MCAGAGLASRFPPGQLYRVENHTELTPKPANGHFRHLCIDCGTLFRVKRQLIAHCKAVHGGTRLSCPQCPCTFASSSGLREHVKRIHQKLARYHCEQCGKGYSIRSNYYDHLATHSGARRNTCTICQKQFTYRHSLNSHLLRIHPEEGAYLKLAAERP